MILAVCIGIIVCIFIGDLWIKNRIERTLAEGETRKILGGRLLLRKHHNRGAILNFADAKRPVVAALSVVMTLAAFILLLLSFGRTENRLLQIGLSLLLGGAFSNTYDRLKRKYVVDYVSFGVRRKGLRNVIFNVSDFCIIIGALLITLNGLR